MRWLVVLSIGIGTLVVFDLAQNQRLTVPTVGPFPTPIPLVTRTPVPMPTATLMPVAVAVPTATPGWKRPSIGSEARIEPASGNQRVAVATSAQALDAMMKAAAARDTIGFGRLMDTSGYYVVYGTRALVLDHGFEDTQVRILDGTHTGRLGWLAAQNVR